MSKRDEEDEQTSSSLHPGAAASVHLPCIQGRRRGRLGLGRRRHFSDRDGASPPYEDDMRWCGVIGHDCRPDCVHSARQFSGGSGIRRSAREFDGRLQRSDIGFLSVFSVSCCLDDSLLNSHECHMQIGETWSQEVVHTEGHMRVQSRVCFIVNCSPKISIKDLKTLDQTKV
ncbi:hypothetical protein EJB05_27568 [Eragrostis curvula]|uniref:Uncharacterized protein n=1 Tax=Eragrostis curvula TaxID=38414 RepID=A0A5J9UP01_9POAL|nr:hypothetical protein EJB05_27568 [Eragrostis curvula]